MTPFERGLLLGLRLARGRTLTTADLRAEFGLSQAQAKRDLLVVEVTLSADHVIGERGQRILALHPARVKR